MRAPSVRTELFVNFNLAELDQLANPQWEEPSARSRDVDEEAPMPQMLPIAPAGHVSPEAALNDGSNTNDTLALEDECSERAEHAKRQRSGS
eukprot:SAG11_NODE_1299_length_5264_cov_5.517715_2_plen_92_part_00